MFSRNRHRNRPENCCRNSHAFRAAENRGHEPVRNLEDSELPPRFAARCRSDRRSPPLVRNRQNSGKDPRTVHANERGRQFTRCRNTFSPTSIDWIRVVRSSDIKIDFEKRHGVRQSARVTQSAKRGSRRAAAKFDQRFARGARTKHSCRSRERVHLRDRSCIHSTIWKRRTASWNSVVGKCRERTELAIADKAQPRLV